jgi:hypothetical protein
LSLAKYFSIICIRDVDSGAPATQPPFTAILKMMQKTLIVVPTRKDVRFVRRIARGQGNMEVVLTV